MADSLRNEKSLEWKCEGSAKALGLASLGSCGMQVAGVEGARALALRFPTSRASRPWKTKQK